MRALPPDFLIIGMQKSGSYWLTALLDAHPAIRCFPSRPGHVDGTGEAHLFDNLARLESDYVRFRKSMRSKLEGAFADLVPDDLPDSPAGREALVTALRARFNAYCDEQRRRTGKPVVGEKTTETVHHPALVEKVYPGIRKVCILRDPRDRAVSFFFHQKRKKRFDDADTLTDRHVLEYVDRVRADYSGLLAMRDPVHVLTYESLSASTQDVTQSLLAFLAVDAAPAVVETMVHAASFEHLAGRQPGDADPGSHFRQGRPGDWSRHITCATGLQVVDLLERQTHEVERRFDLDLASYRAPANEPPHARVSR